MRFINIESCKLLFDVGRLDDHINSVAVSATGRHLVAIMDSGNLNVYNLATLYSQLNQVGCWLILMHLCAPVYTLS